MIFSAVVLFAKAWISFALVLGVCSWFYFDNPKKGNAYLYTRGYEKERRRDKAILFIATTAIMYVFWSPIRIPWKTMLEVFTNMGFAPPTIAIVVVLAIYKSFVSIINADWRPEKRLEITVFAGKRKEK